MRSLLMGAALGLAGLWPAAVSAQRVVDYREVPAELAPLDEEVSPQEHAPTLDQDDSTGAAVEPTDEIPAVESGELDADSVRALDAL